MKFRIPLLIVLALACFALAAPAAQTVTFLRSISSPDGSFHAGETAIVSDANAAAWVDAGYAEYSDGTWIEAFSDATQAIATNTIVTVLATESSDLLGEWTNNAFTPKVAGWYHVQAAATWDVDAAAGGHVTIVVYKGASDTFIADQRVASSGLDLFLCTAGVIRLATTDTMTVKAWQSTGATRNIASAAIRIKRL